MSGREQQASWPIAASVSEWSEATLPLLSTADSVSGAEQETIPPYTPKYSQAVLDTFNCKLVSAHDAMKKFKSQPGSEWGAIYEAQKARASQNEWLLPSSMSPYEPWEFVEVTNVSLHIKSGAAEGPIPKPLADIVRPSEKELEHPLASTKGSIIQIDGRRNIGSEWTLGGGRRYVKRMFLVPAFYDHYEESLPDGQGCRHLMWNIVAAELFTVKGLWEMPNFQDLA